MEILNCSVDMLNMAIASKLGLLSEAISTAELSEIHAFIKEAKSLRETLLSLGPIGEYEEAGEEVGATEAEAGEDLLNAYVQACHLIKEMYQLIDDERVKETGSEWVFDETRELMNYSREAVGSRIPELPALRVVSPKKTTVKAEEKKSKKAGKAKT